MPPNNKATKDASLTFRVVFMGEHGHAIGETRILVVAKDVNEWAVRKNEELGPPDPAERRFGYKKDGDRLVGVSIISRIIPISEEDLQKIAIAKAQEEDSGIAAEAFSIIAVPVPSR